MLKLILGKSGSGKTNKLYKSIKENLNQEKVFLIVPEQSNLAAEQNLFAFLNVSALLNVEVLTLSRMADRVLAEEGGDDLIRLNNSSKAMIIYDVLNKEKNNLKYLGKTDKNIEIISNMITEFKKHNVDMEKVKSANIEDKFTKIKLEDIELIYQDYNNILKENFIDENDILNIVAEKLDISKIFDGAFVFIDDFLGFTPQEFLVFEKILKKAECVNVAISTDSLEIVDKERDIFYFNKLFANRLIEIAKKNNISYEVEILDSNMRLTSEDLKYLEEVLSSHKYIKPYEKKLERIKLFLANNTYSELEYVANEILKLVKNYNYKYNEIVVCSGDLENYKAEAKVVFNKYDIPLFIDEKKDLNQNVLVKFILSILEIFSKNWSFESVFNYLKIGMTKIDADKIYLLENYCRKWGIRNYKWFKPFAYEQKNEVQDELELVRQEIVEPLVKLKEDISKNKTAEEITKQLYNFLIENKINVILDEKIKTINNIEITNEYNTSYKILIEILDEIVSIFGNNKMSFETYRDLIQVGFSNSELGKIPATQDQVILADIKRSRNNNIKVCFVIGINDGNFPKINRFEGFLNDNDRALLKENGIELAKSSIDAMYESNFEIYNVLSLASDKLYLSYCSQDIDGKAIRPSIFIRKIKNIFPNIEVNSDIIHKNYYITNKIATFDDAISVYKNWLDGEEITDEWKKVLSYYFNNEKNKLTKVLKGIQYTNLADNISEENIYKLYGDKLSTSVSKLEQYRRCPFSFHIKYGLKLKEKEDFQLQSIETGTFMHEVIDNFFAILDDRKINIRQIDDDTSKQIVKEIIDDFLNTSKYYIFSSTPKFKTLTKKLIRVVTESIDYIVYSIKNSKFDVLGHEIEFGKTGKYKPIIMELENGKKVEIIGKIDRLDIGKLDEKTYVRIIDYKSSIKNLDMNQVEAGLQIQLITYLDAISKQEDFLPSGILYLGLTDNQVNGKRNLTEEEIAQEIKKKYRMNGVVLADVNVIKMMDTSLGASNSSDIIPVSITKDGQISNSKSSVLNNEEFEQLQKSVNDTIKELSNEILSGKIDIKPYSYKQQDACQYCLYKSICMFNPNLKGNSYNYIK